MKATVVILILISVVAAFAAATGIQRVSSSNIGGTTITYHDAMGRYFAAITSVTCAIAAFGCAKRRMYGWWLVAVILATVLVVSTGWAIWQAATFDLPLSAMLLGAVGELVKIALWCWLLFGFWRRRKNYFQQTVSAPPVPQS
jgi:hypothetical protein